MMLMAACGDPHRTPSTALGNGHPKHDEARRQSCTTGGLSQESRSALPEAELPEDWQETVGGRGERLLVPNLKTRRRKAVVVAIITGVVWSGLVLLVRESLSEANLWGVTLMVTAFGIWLAHKTLRMLLTRQEWRIERGRLVYQRRFAGKVTELCQARALELTESRDSNNDEWYHLHAIELSPLSFVHVGKTSEKILMTHSIRGPTELRCLARWLSREAGIPVYDRIPSEAEKQVEIARLLEQLSGTGKFGRFAAGLISRANRNKSGLGA